LHRWESAIAIALGTQPPPPPPPRLTHLRFPVCFSSNLSIINKKSWAGDRRERCWVGSLRLGRWQGCYSRSCQGTLPITRTSIRCSSCSQASLSYRYVSSFSFGKHCRCCRRDDEDDGGDDDDDDDQAKGSHPESISLYQLQFYAY